jgi:aminopeptidase YwaD
VRILWLFLAAAVAAATPVAEDAGERAYAHVVALAGAAPRPAGTEAERRGVDYVAARLREMGYRVEVVAFPFPYFETLKVGLEVTSPARIALNPRALVYSPSTEGVLAAPLVFAALGRPEDFRAVDVQGRVALVQRGEITFLEKVENAARAGARAVVVYNHEPGPLVGTLTRRSSVPAVTISREEGLRLRDLLAQGPVLVLLVVDTWLETRTSHNVVATLAGRDGGRVLLGAHVDSVEGSPGANDNASGVGAALEAARLLRAQPPPWTVEVVAFGAEELGLFGSEAYARSERVRGLRAMLNLDMVGVGPRLLVGNTGSDRRVVEAALDAARRLGVRLEARRMGASDHVPFERAGVPAAMLHRPDDPNYHSPEDTPDKVRPDLLDPVVRLAAAVLRSPSVVAGPGTLQPTAFR